MDLVLKFMNVYPNYILAHYPGKSSCFLKRELKRVEDVAKSSGISVNIMRFRDRLCLGFENAFDRHLFEGRSYCHRENFVGCNEKFQVFWADAVSNLLDSKGIDCWVGISHDIVTIWFGSVRGYQDFTGAYNQGWIDRAIADLYQKRQSEINFGPEV